MTYFLSSLLKSLMKYWKHKSIVVLALPAFIFIFVFCYIPMYGITIAFKDYNFMEGILKSPWIGFKNFNSLFELPDIWKVTKNTIFISALKIIFCFPAPILFAILLNELRSIKFKRIVQTISYMPHFLSWVVLSGLLMSIFSPTQGVVNYLLSLFGKEPFMFLGDGAWFIRILIISDLWKGVGFGSIIYLAQISNIDQNTVEAAIIDGAGRIKQAIYITLPGLLPMITYFFVFSISGILNAGFDQIFNLYNGMVMDVADILDTYIYRVGIINMDYSISTAAGFVRNVVSMLLLIAASTFAKRYSDYSIW